MGSLEINVIVHANKMKTSIYIQYNNSYEYA